jgi:hypothetical protein
VELLAGAEDDLDLLDGAPVAVEHVVDARPDQPAAERPRAAREPDGR